MFKPNAFQLKILKDLISIDTVNPPGNEMKAAQYLADMLSPMGFEVEIQHISKQRANLVATKRWGNGRILALCGHLDIVAAHASNWKSDPFDMQTRDGLLYGRGTSDMKGGISAMVAAAKKLSEEENLCGTLQLVFVADEELYTAGTLAYLEKFEKPRTVIIGEPTGMDVCVAHRGVTRYNISFIGQSGHASAPDKANNPIYDAARFVLAAEKQNLILAQKKHELLPSPTLAITILEGGEQGNSIPCICKVVVDRRTIPGEDVAAIKLEAQKIVRDAKITGKMPEFDVFVQISPSQPLHASTLGDRCKDVLLDMGLPSRIRDFGACCDQVAFIDAGVDCVLVGPGNLEQAHTSDEYIKPEQLALATEFYYRFCLRELRCTDTK